MWPQITMIVLIAMSATISLIKNGESKGEYSFITTVIALALEGWILYEGGFFAPLMK